ncbi:hypothetical protein CEXT_640891 [Caerostris extrusa]|uniref:Uncharacterized protein n=1 Tax=Caerostris extrusa TaxID=172846 RepID=A0AAV4MUZ8_CAEEX|nr:hypothetical protein CEXT_640891 [Caerostris extrusa]
MDETRAIITYRNRVLIIERTDKPIDTPKANFTDTENDMSQGDAIIINDDDNDETDDELLPPPNDFCYHRLSLLPSSNTASCDFLCCQRFQLLSSFSSATVVFYSCDFCYPSSLSLLPSSNTASCDIFCCSHLLLRVISSAADVFHCRRHLPLLLSPATIVRLPLLTSSSSAAAPMMISKERLTFAISDRPSSE